MVEIESVVKAAELGLRLRTQGYKVLAGQLVPENCPFTPGQVFCEVCGEYKEDKET